MPLNVLLMGGTGKNRGGLLDADVLLSSIEAGGTDGGDGTGGRSKPSGTESCGDAAVQPVAVAVEGVVVGFGKESESEDDSDL